MLGIKKKQA